MRAYTSNAEAVEIVTGELDCRDGALSSKGVVNKAEVGHDKDLFSCEPSFTTTGCRKMYRGCVDMRIDNVVLRSRIELKLPTYLQPASVI